MIEPALDCKHYLGDRPCAHRQRCRCGHYSPMGTRIAIIKLGALGDVVRTACLLDTLKRVYPVSHITWISKPSGVRILSGHPAIDTLMEFNAENCFTLTQQSFDLVLSLDKEAEPAALCKAMQSPDKRGMTLSRFGTTTPANPACSEYFNLGLDDDLKFNHNTRSYPHLIHDALELPYIRQPYRLYASREDFDHADAIFAGFSGVENETGQIIGLNTGSGDVFANKAPSRQRWLDIARALLSEGYRLALLGGPGEHDLNFSIIKDLNEPTSSVIYVGCDNSEKQFVAIVDRCDALVSGDTLALHIGVARRKPVVALFGPTCHQEIDLFDLGVKLVSPLGCGPCYSRHCDKKPSCMDRIETVEVVRSVRAVVKNARDRQFVKTGIGKSLHSTPSSSPAIAHPQHPQQHPPQHPQHPQQQENTDHAIASGK